MKAILYYLNVLFISYEFVAFLLIFALFIFFEHEIKIFLTIVHANEKAIDSLVLYPVAVVGWMFKSGKEVLFPANNNKLLHQWPDYWKLRVHFNVGIIYAIFFLLPCLIVWLFDWLDTMAGISVFAACSTALTISAFSFYNSQLTLKEILIHARNDIEL